MKNNRNSKKRTNRAGNNSFLFDSSADNTHDINEGRNISNDRVKKDQRKVPVVWVIIIDVFVATLIMIIFYITNYVAQPELNGSNLPVPSSLTSEETPTPLVSEPVSSVSPAETTQPNPTAIADSTLWRTKFEGKFTDGDVVQTDSSYQSANINVSIEKIQSDGVTYYIADIYVTDLKYFMTAFAKQPDVMGSRESTDIVAKENNAIIAINGDHCVDNDGPVIRNGQLYRDKKFADALVMNYDGSMQTYSADQLDMEKIKTEGAWQMWTFGPMLLKDGQPMTQYNSTLLRGNPRTAVGYFEPGHYCFVVVDGRQPGYSDPGYTMEQMSQLFYNLGCKVAFNLDGGQSSEMVFLGNIVNQPYNGGRSTTDILYIADK